MKKEDSLIEEIIEPEEIPETTEFKQPISLWKWYFGWHPRLFLTIPFFLIFAYQGLWFIVAEFQDIVYFFQTTPVTWGSILLILLGGSILLWFILGPIYISFASIGWLYEISIGKQTAWKKFLSIVGIILLALVGPNLLRLFTNWILGIL